MIRPSSVIAEEKRVIAEAKKATTSKEKEIIVMGYIKAMCHEKYHTFESQVKDFIEKHNLN